MTQYCWVCKQSADLYRAQRVIHQLQLQVYTVMVQPLHCLPPDYRISAIHTERKPHPQVKNEVGLISPPAALELLHTSREDTCKTSGRACHLRLTWTRKAAILYNSVSDISLLKIEVILTIQINCFGSSMMCDEVYHYKDETIRAN